MSEIKAQIEAIKAARARSNPAPIAPPRRPSTPIPASGGVMPTIKPLDASRPRTPAAASVTSGRSHKTLAEYYGALRNGRPVNIRGSDAGTSVSGRTTESMAEVREELRMTREDFAALKAETSNIKTLLLQLLAEKASDKKPK